MGNKSRKKGKMYLSASEWSQEWGGAKVKSQKDRDYTRIVYNQCALSFEPLEDPVATADGTCFERENILQYIDQYGIHPRSGQKLVPSDLISLKFHKNNDGENHCPITYKVFNDHTHIVAIRTTGNVFSFDAVNEMNLKFKNLRDLLDDTPFTKKDVMHLQDPNDLMKYNRSEFHFVKNNLTLAGNVVSDEEDDDMGANIRNANPAMAAVMEQLRAKDDAKKEKKKVLKEQNQKSLAAIFSSYAEDEESKPGINHGGGKSEAKKAVPVKPAAEPAAPKMLYGNGTHLYAAASFTTTALTPLRKDKKEQVTETLIKQKMYEHLKLYHSRAYLSITTSLGDINFELYPFSAPQTVDNFITHCLNGYYNGTIFHRSIRNFMIQGGDPEGTGMGGESIFGEPFKDEIDKRWSHEGKGWLCMANSGPDSNKSQFYITYKSCKHLDGKHTIFGKVVGGFETLSKMEKLPTNDEDRPRDPPFLIKTQVFVNPLVEARTKVLEALDQVKVSPEEEARKKRQREEEEKKGAWFSNPVASFNRPKQAKEGVGKYLDVGKGSVLDAKPAKKQKQAQEEPEAPMAPPAKTKIRTGFDFSSW